MALQPRMADSVEPEAIPRLFAVQPNGVAAYFDGSYAWDPNTPPAFPRHWRICVTGDPAIAPHARVLDVEKYDATPQDVKAYADARQALGEKTIVYCSRSTIPLVQDADPEWLRLEWWIATLENRWYTPDDINHWLRDHLARPLDPASIRAIQWAGRGSYDESSIWGNPGWNITPH